MAAIEPKLTVDDLALLPDDGKRYELIEGELLVSRVRQLYHTNLLQAIYKRNSRCICANIVLVGL
jgi:hypothetical protein